MGRQLKEYSEALDIDCIPLYVGDVVVLVDGAFLYSSNEWPQKGEKYIVSQSGRDVICHLGSNTLWRSSRFRKVR